MPLTLEPGCIAKRKASIGTGALRRHIVITKVMPGGGWAEGIYLQKNKTYQWKFRRFLIANLDVILNAPERISAEAIAGGQSDPYNYAPGQNGA